MRTNWHISVPRSYLLEALRTDMRREMRQQANVAATIERARQGGFYYPEQPGFQIFNSDRLDKIKIWIPFIEQMADDNVDMTMDDLNFFQLSLDKLNLPTNEITKIQT